MILEKLRPFIKLAINDIDVWDSGLHLKLLLKTNMGTPVVWIGQLCPGLLLYELAHNCCYVQKAAAIDIKTRKAIFAPV